VIEVSDEKIKVECRLTTKGTQKADAQVISDLDIPDPKDAVGKQIVENVMGVEQTDVDKSDDS
jgi:hypothetical protein